MTPYNEREVLKLLQEESTQRQGFEMIVAQYSEQLYWQIRRLVLSHEDANDLLQNTFIKAWTNIDYFRAEAKLSTWLYRIALNECLTFLNRQRAVTTLAIDDPEAAVVQKLENNDKLLIDFFAENRQEIPDNGFTRRVMRHLPWLPLSFGRSTPSIMSEMALLRISL